MIWLDRGLRSIVGAIPCGRPAAGGEGERGSEQGVQEDCVPLHPLLKSYNPGKEEKCKLDSLGELI